MKIIVGKAMTRAAAGLAALMLVGASQGTSQGASKAENGARRISDEASPHHRALSPPGPRIRVNGLCVRGWWRGIACPIRPAFA